MADPVAGADATRRTTADPARRAAHEFGPVLPVRALSALREGRTVEAVKAVRELEGLDLAGAKARIDAYLATDPALRKRVAERQREFRRRLIGWALAIDAIVLAAVAAWWFSR